MENKEPCNAPIDETEEMKEFIVEEETEDD